MALSAGTRLGPFVIESPLGAGGMGEVYRAHDTELGRHVALKILPELFATDPERLARFEREARTLAALNHPNIAQLHGLERSTPARALVMELVEGEDLAAHIGRGQVPLAEALSIARQMADALEAAHEQGIVHRDLKPANVMVRPDGTVKVLDFGLAKALTTDSSGATSGDPAHSPTLTAAVGTQLGIILGTAAYMAPEQARGKPIDKRADIWAFGVVLLEMLSGSRTFKGEEISDVLAAVLRQDIEWKALPAGTPPALRRLLERCLDRDPKTRLRDIGEARVELARIERGVSDETLAGATDVSAPSRRSRTREALAWSVAAVATVAALGLWLLRSPGASAGTGSVVRLSFVAPEQVVAEAAGALISPDGEKLVFSGRSAEGRRMLWLRRLDALEATALPDTEDAIEPFWSPDSKSIAFGAQGKLRRLDLGDVRAQTLADAPRLNGGTWNSTGVIVFSPDYRTPLARVSADGRERTAAARFDEVHGDFGHRYPYFLPDGRHFLYASQRPNFTVVVGSLDSTETKVLLPDWGPAIYASPGWLIYVRNGTVVAHPFDADRLELSGDAVPISAEPLKGAWPQGGSLSVSDTGVLVAQGGAQYGYQLAWLDRSGRQTGTIGSARQTPVAEFPRLSPDGRRVVVQRAGPASQNLDLWIGDLARGTFDRLTTSPALDQLGLWSRDGASVLWSTTRNGRNGIHQVSIRGGDEQPIVRGTVFPVDVSPDGRWLFYVQRAETTRGDIWVHSMAAGASPPAADRVIVNSDADELCAQVSPDGQWLAYSSDVTGNAEVYVRRLGADATVGEATRVSTGGGAQPRWSPDGRELFYVNAAQGYLSAMLMAVPVRRGGASLEYGEATPLFKVRMFPLPTVTRDYDVSPDGQHFLVGTAVGDVRPAPATIVLNWAAALKR
jgi:Tol biopolymer transport system component